MVVLLSWWWRCGGTNPWPLFTAHTTRPQTAPSIPALRQTHCLRIAPVTPPANPAFFLYSCYASRQAKTSLSPKGGKVRMAHYLAGCRRNKLTRNSDASEHGRVRGVNGRQHCSSER